MEESVSSYFPAVCSGCGKNGLCKNFTKMTRMWKSRFVKSRNDILKKLNTTSSLDETYPFICEGKKEFLSATIIATDYELPGYSDNEWRTMGIKSDCCKLEVLIYIPYDSWLMLYNDGDFLLPPDFDTKGVIEWSRLEDENSEKKTAVVVSKTLGMQSYYKS